MPLPWKKQLADALARIKDGTLVVDVNKPSVRSFANKRWRTIRIVDRSSNQSPTYRFVEIYRNGGRKKVARYISGRVRAA